MISGGHSQFVMDGRFAFQQRMRETYTGHYRNVTGRTVRAFLSQNHIDPPMSAEIFVLASEAGDEVSDVQAH